LAVRVKIVIFGVALAINSHAAAKPAEQLSCLTQSLNEDDFIAFGEIAAVEDQTKRTKKEPDFMRLGMLMSICARQYGWTENERNNSIAYAVAFPVSRGLRLLGESAGYAAIDRLYAANPESYRREAELKPETLYPLIDRAVADGLKLDGSEQARKTAARYLDSLYSTAAYRKNFEANKFEKPKGP
jgi:hypothetical protein